MKNLKIREALKKSGMKQWELADLLEISESTMCIRLRKELPEEEQDRILGLIKERGC